MYVCVRMCGCVRSSVCVSVCNCVRLGVCNGRACLWIDVGAVQSVVVVLPSQIGDLNI